MSPNPRRVAARYLRAAAATFAQAFLQRADSQRSSLAQRLLSVVEELAAEMNEAPRPPAPARTRGRKPASPPPEPPPWNPPTAQEVVAEFRRRVTSGWYSFTEEITAGDFTEWVEKYLEKLWEGYPLLGPVPFFQHAYVEVKQGAVEVSGDLLGDEILEGHHHWIDAEKIDRSVEESGGEVLGHTQSWRPKDTRWHGEERTYVSYPFRARWPLPSSEFVFGVVSESDLLRAAEHALART